MTPDDEWRTVAKIRGVLDGLEVDVAQSAAVIREHLDRLEDRCGGCAGLGKHRRWCPAVVGARAARIGQMADDLDDLGDTLRPELANRCWALAERLRNLAEEEAATRCALPVPRPAPAEVGP